MPNLFIFISGHRLAVLSTISPEGLPQSALVGIAVTPELEIIFDTVASSRKFRNLLATPRAAFVIGWDSEVTLQYEGDARIPDATELPRYQEIYLSKWPECRAHLTWPGITYFIVRPTWIRYSDFGIQPPLIAEHNL